MDQRQLAQRYRQRTQSDVEGEMHEMMGDREYAALLYTMLDEIRVRVRT